MVSCPRCGAGVEASALACPYCQTQTAFGREQLERERQAIATEQSQRAAERDARLQALSKKARHAMFWAIAGSVTCCFPAGMLGFALGLQARSAVKEAGGRPPFTATVAIVLGLVSVVAFCGGVVLYVRDSRERDARIATLSAQVEKGRSSEAIDQPLACALAELELLQHGHGSVNAINISGFQCDGKLAQTGDRALLADVRFHTGADERHVLTACLVRGARWSVAELRDDGSCSPRSARQPSASGSGAPAATAP